MRVARDERELATAFDTARAEAEKAFGNAEVYMEKYLEKAVVGAHHVEIQVLCDADGGVLICGERECSIQRRHQKLIEETPSPAVGPELRARMGATAVAAAKAIGYEGAGTLEFLLDREGRFWFMEMNTRLQVEHPVTEAVTGLDLVREQLCVGGGGRLSRTGRAPISGHAIELRLNAEDPARGFMPSAGVVTRFRPGLGPGVRLDTHVYEGYRIPPDYDSLVAKLIVWGEDRETCVARKRGSRRISRCSSRVVETPRMSVSASARSVRATQVSRSSPHTISFATRES